MSQCVHLFEPIELIFTNLLSGKLHVGQCSSNAQCTSPEYCCRKDLAHEANECKSSCISEACQSDSDCGPPDECCSRKKVCTKCCENHLPNGIVVLIIISILLAFVIPSTATIWCCYRKKSRQFEPPPGMITIPLPPVINDPTPEYSVPGPFIPTHPLGPPPPYNGDEEDAGMLVQQPPHAEPD